MVRILYVGKKHDTIYGPIINHFEKRLGQLTKLTCEAFLHSDVIDESRKLLNAITEDDCVILFDERGKNFTSQQLASYIEVSQNSSKRLVCVIGGAYGVNDSIRNRANYVLAFGTSVFPHQLIRVMALEQLYRSYSINAGSKYHH